MHLDSLCDEAPIVFSSVLEIDCLGMNGLPLASHLANCHRTQVESLFLQRDGDLVHGRLDGQQQKDLRDRDLQLSAWLFQDLRVKSPAIAVNTVAASSTVFAMTPTLS